MQVPTEATDIISLIGRVTSSCELSNMVLETDLRSSTMVMQSPSNPSSLLPQSSSNFTWCVHIHML